MGVAVVGCSVGSGEGAMVGAVDGALVTGDSVGDSVGVEDEGVWLGVDVMGDDVGIDCTGDEEGCVEGVEVVGLSVSLTRGHLCALIKDLSPPNRLEHFPSFHLQMLPNSSHLLLHSKSQVPAHWHPPDCLTRPVNFSVLRQTEQESPTNAMLMS